MGRRDEARQHLERSLQIEADLVRLEKVLEETARLPNDPRPRREAGEICLRNGQVAEGLRWLNGALDVAPNDRPTHQLLADFYASQGDTQRASLHRRKAAGPF